jgi:hypothetical protein
LLRDASDDQFVGAQEAFLLAGVVLVEGPSRNSSESG